MQAAIRTAILVLSAGATLAHAADLTIVIDKVNSNDGQVMVALYDRGADFLERPARNAAVQAIAGTTTVRFKDLAPGDYGVAVYHDANGNGRLDSNAMGIPVEQVGFSNDAQGLMGPPSFDAAKFTVPASGAALTVNLH